MIRIGRMTDYGIVLLTAFARQGDSPSLTARDLSRETELPLPTVSKLLKTLCRGGILTSHRGIHGGYRLSRAPETIPIVEVIEVLEGPVAITDCSSTAEEGSSCSLESRCPAKGNWQRISFAIRNALAQVSLAEMAAPVTPVSCGETQSLPTLAN